MTPPRAEFFEMLGFLFKVGFLLGMTGCLFTLPTFGNGMLAAPLVLGSLFAGPFLMRLPRMKQEQNRWEMMLFCFRCDSFFIPRT